MSLRDQLFALVDASVDAAGVVDSNLTLLHCNKSYVSLMGVRERELRTRKFSGVCHEFLRMSSCSDGGCLALRAIRTGRHIRFDQVESVDQRFIFNVTAIPIQDDVSGGVLVLETYRDVTAENRMQGNYKMLLERERRQNELLQEAVRERTADLERSLAELKATRSQLVHSEKMSSMGRLVAGIAHELNNPINFISGNVDFLEQYVERLFALTDTLVGCADTIQAKEAVAGKLHDFEIDFVRKDLRSLIAALRTGAERVARIVQDLRAFSRLDETSFKDANLNEGIAMTLNLARPHAKGRVELVSDLGRLPLVRCNSAHINQVVLNLVVNAIDAIRGSGTVTVRTRQSREGEVVIEVEDTGDGIAPEVIEKIFEPFFTTKEVGKGTGLGLSISYGIARAHGGRLEVSSAVGCGSTFRLALPVLSPPGQGREDAPSSQVPGASRQ